MNKPETPEQWAEWAATEVMGWKLRHCYPRKDDQGNQVFGRTFWHDDLTDIEVTRWDPFSDLNHCRELEMKIKEMGLHLQYSGILISISNNGELPEQIEDDFMEALRLGRECQFRTTTATAPQRLEAMWQCVTHNKESNE